MKNIHFMLLIVSGIQKKNFGIGQNQSRLDWPTKTLLPIEIYTLDLLILRVLKLLYNFNKFSFKVFK